MYFFHYLFYIIYNISPRTQKCCQHWIKNAIHAIHFEIFPFLAVLTAARPKWDMYNNRILMKYRYFKVSFGLFFPDGSVYGT